MATTASAKPTIPIMLISIWAASPNGSTGIACSVRLVSTIDPGSRGVRGLPTAAPAAELDAALGCAAADGGVRPVRCAGWTTSAVMGAVVRAGAATARAMAGVSVGVGVLEGTGGADLARDRVAAGAED